MNHNVFKIMGTGLFAAGLLVGCGKDAQQVANNVDKTAQAASVNGTWKTSCGQLPLVSDLFSLGFKSDAQQLDLGASLSITTIYSDAANCATPAVTVVENGSYTIGNKTDQGNYLFDARVDSVSITPNSDAGRDLLNLKHICGITDWKTSQPRDVTSITQSGALLQPPCWQKTPRNIYDIERQDNNQIKFGLNKNGLDRSSPEKRPTELDQSLVFTRQ